MKTNSHVGLSVVLLVGTLIAAAPAAASTLKVSSFPSGAQVIVDGVNTGKVTPMSIALADGDHTVTVAIPGSGWNPDTRVVTIVPGNNDLSVTLLPAMTAGPRGPTGPAGAPATVRPAAPGECATGGIVVTSGSGDVSLPVCNGAQGPQGIDGAQGTQGLQGVQGVAGATGPMGPAGREGPAGGIPVVDPRTLIGFGENLFVDVGGGMGSFGLSPVAVEIARVAVAGHSVSYQPGRATVAPFAIAPSNEAEALQLASWFAVLRTAGLLEATRSLTFKLTNGEGGDQLTVQLDRCVPSSLDSGFAGPARMVVECREVASVTAGGPTVGGGEESLYLPGAAPPQLRLRVQSEVQLVAGVAGGGQRWSPEGVELDLLGMRAGFVNDGGFSAASIIEWIVDSLTTTPGGPHRSIELQAEDRSPIAEYDDTFLTYIGLIDPARTIHLPDSVRDEERTLIRIGFDLVMQPGRQ